MKSKPREKFYLRELVRKDQEALARFLSSLKPQTLYFWNRFGNHLSRARAQAVARQQVTKSLREEKGFVVYADKKLVGYSFLRFFPEKPQKKRTTNLGMVVREGFQNRGIGKQMVKAMIQYCKKKNIQKIWLSSYSDNHKAVRFYKRLGFMPEGVFLFDEYFQGRPRHVLSMTKFLNPRIQRQAERLKRRFL